MMVIAMIAMIGMIMLVTMIVVVMLVIMAVRPMIVPGFAAIAIFIGAGAAFDLEGRMADAEAADHQRIGFAQEGVIARRIRHQRCAVSAVSVVLVGQMWT